MARFDPAPGASGNARLGFLLLVGLVAIVAAGKPILCDTMDPDCFWHLRVAEQLRQQLSSGTLGPIRDHLSYASMQDPWTPYSWLAELGMDALWRCGGWRAAVAVQSILTTSFILFILLACRARPAGSSRRIPGGVDSAFTTNPAVPGELQSVLATVAAAVLSLAYLSFRPVTAALVLLSGCVWLLTRDRRSGERTAAVWLLAPLTAVLINVHLYAIFVPMWVSALWIGSLLERRKAGPEDRAEAERRVERYSWLLTATGVACLATPMLPGVVVAALRYQAADPMVASGVIAEMRPFYQGFAGAISAAVVLLIVGCAIYHRRKVRIGEWLWLALSMLLMFRLGRFAPLFAMVAAPLFALTLPSLSNQILLKPHVCALMAVVFIGGVVRIALSFPRPTTTFEAWLERQGPQAPGYPCAAADFVAERVKPASGRLINEFTWGGYLEWRLGGRYQTLLDGRTQLFSPEFWRATYLGSEEERSKYLSRICADAAVLPARKSVFEQTLTRQGWKLAYQDERAKVLLPPAALLREPAPKWPFATVLFGE